MHYGLFIFFIFFSGLLGAQTWNEFKLTASDGGNDDQFGEQVAIDGDRLVVGARFDDDSGNNSGSTYIYTWNSNNLNETILRASDGTADNEFGSSVAVDGDRVVVGAESGGPGGDDGSAYIYEWNGISWNETKLYGSPTGNFGHSVAIDGDQVVVGAQWDTDGSGSQQTGSAYIYKWNVTTSNWDSIKLTASDGASGDQFGVSVAIDSHRVVVGAIGDDDVAINAGSVYVFTWNGISWDTTRLYASDGSNQDFFGHSVAIDGNRIVVGAYKDDAQGTESGSVYLFDWNGSSWDETKLTPTDGADYDHFGFNVAIDRNYIVVGAYNDDHQGISSGSIYVFDWDGSSWGETKLNASDGTIDDDFGYSVAIDGNRLVVGARNDDDQGTESGSVYVYEQTTVGFSSPKKLDIKVFPNPTTKQLIITSTDKNLKTLQLWNLSGELLKSWTWPANTSRYHIQLRNLPAGLYNLKLQGAQHSNTARVVLR